ncbi:Methyltransferase domain-containing protein [Micromonospora sediminicola]|uniref:Methyltransferase domain-containing protein n=1 Tax=Micromonospora sediminicola TaxID=946078 RepID=A0A1A9B9P3_9ACTN|nr:class I SAM-dependent methyltransferase [Micromonospora sediminicola]SBT65694.1 Methyltransferase domain-containing protein [Micromonospora sediminicola]
MRVVDVSEEAFRAAVDKLRVPGMGTEVLAPLLNALVRFHRPRRVLEIGMGYTTPFLVAALASVEEEVSAEARGLADKSRSYVEGGTDLDDAWLYTEPAMLAPSYYLTPYRSRFVAVDNLSGGSAAEHVLDVLAELGLDDRVTVVNADLHDCADRLPDDLFPIDLAWVDAWECLYFFDHFWDRINPDGGLVAMHYLMTYPEGEAILEYFAEVQRARRGELEIINLLEPHKLAQNSVTILRRTTACRPRVYAEQGGGIRYTRRLQEDAAGQLRLAGADSARVGPDARRPLK